MSAQFSKYFFFILLIAVGCGNPNSQKETPSPRIRVGVLNGPSAISIVKMMNDARSEKDSRTVEFILKSEPSQIKSMMYREEVEFAFLPSTTAAILYNMGFNYQVAVIPLWGTMYLIGEDETVKSIDDLKGKTVYQMGRGVTPDVVFRFILEKRGLIPDKDIKIDYSFPSHIDLANAVKAGIAKLGVISEPQVSMIIKQNPKVKSLIDLTREWDRATLDSIPFAQTFIVVNRTFAGKYPEKVKQFLIDYENNINWINEHPAEAAGLIVRNGILPDSMVAYSCIPRCNMKYVLAGSVRNQVMNYFNLFFLLNKDIIGGKMPDENFFYNE